MAPSTKIKVSLQVSAKSTEQTTRVDCNFNAQDTVESFKERVALVFEQTGLGVPAGVQADLRHDGQILSAGSRLSDCGVKAGSALDFVLHFSEATLANQCAELVRSASSTVSSDELGFMYSHRHGVGANDALSLLGLKGTSLEAFLGEQKLFTVAQGKVALTVKEPEAAPTPAGTPAGTLVEPDEELDEDEDEEAAESSEQATPGIQETITIASDEEEDPKVNVDAWKSVGQRFKNALANIADEDDEEDGLQPRPASTEGKPLRRTVASNDQISDIKVDVPAWKSVGSRVGAAFSCVDDEDEEDDFSETLLLRGQQSQKNTSRRVSFNDVVSKVDIDVDAWKSVTAQVGGAVASAIKEEDEEECQGESQEPPTQKRYVSSVHEISDIKVDVPNWQCVGARVRNAFASIAAEDSDEDDFLPCRVGGVTGSGYASQQAIAAA